METESEYNPRKPYNIYETRPLKEVRLDCTDHIPEHNQHKEAGRCKMPGCKGKSHFKCDKCNVYIIA